jgi:hypothetical protein
MPASITLTDKQLVAAGITLLDQDGQPFVEVPVGVTTGFVSSDPTVAGIVQVDDFNIEVTSGTVGSSIITATVTLQDSSVLTDTLAVAVINSAPGVLNFTVGSPQDEPPPGKR